MNSEEFFDLINKIKVKPAGTLRFYGEWFGRPYDNYHLLTDCLLEDGILTLIFDQGERIKIWNPNKISLNNKELKIKKAECVDFIRNINGKTDTEETSLIVDRYVSNNQKIFPHSGKIYKKLINNE